MATTKKSATKPATTTAASKAVTVAALSADLMDQIKTTKPQLSLAPAEKREASRATFSGFLLFGLVSIGVKGFKAADVEKVSFNNVYLTNPDKVAKGAKPVYAPVKQGSMVDAEGKPVAKENIYSGYKVAEGEFVIVTEEEKKACLVLSDKKMEIVGFVKADSVDPIYFESAEYLQPSEGEASKDFFALLRAAMVSRGVVAIARLAQRGREHTLVIRPYDKDGLVAHYMYFDNEVRSFDKWTPVVIDEKKAELVGKVAQIIDALTEKFDPTQYYDSYTRTLQGLVNDKSAGNTVVLPAPVAAPVANDKADLMSLLEASLKARTTKSMAVTAAA